MKKLYRPTIIAILGLMLLWVSLSGYFNLLQLSFGILSTCLVVWLTIHLKLLTSDGSRLKVLPRYPLYLFWLAREVVLSNISLAKIILAPKILLHRQIIYTKTYQSSDLAKTLYANSVTLTPGTLTIDIAEEGFLVHSLAKAFTDDIRSNKMNLRVAKLEPVDSRDDAK